MRLLTALVLGFSRFSRISRLKREPSRN
jgi:hypothetical protein